MSRAHRPFRRYLSMGKQRARALEHLFQFRFRFSSHNVRRRSTRQSNPEMVNAARRKETIELHSRLCTLQTAQFKYCQNRKWKKNRLHWSGEIGRRRRRRTWSATTDGIKSHVEESSAASTSCKVSNHVRPHESEDNVLTSGLCPHRICIRITYRRVNVKLHLHFIIIRGLAASSWTASINIDLMRIQFHLNTNWNNSILNLWRITKTTFLRAVSAPHSRLGDRRWTAVKNGHEDRSITCHLVARSHKSLAN